MSLPNVPPLSRWQLRARSKVFLLAATVAIALTACDQPRVHGDANAVIVAADTELWAQVEDEFRQHMEPTIQTVRDEWPFRLTQADPRVEENWPQLRRFRQVAAMGPRGTPWVDEALAQAEDPDIQAPGVTTARNVWARGQTVWVLVLGDDDPGAAVGELAADAYERLDEAFRQYVRTRMFTSGADTALADSLARNVGFSLTLPNVYRHRAEDSIFVFRNDNPSPSELIRQITVTWWEPAPEEDPTREELEAWRDELVEAYYTDPQLLEPNVVSFGPVQVDGIDGVEFQSAWVSPPDAWPAGGPFIVRAMRCPEQDRMYLLDAWLYAPGVDKYEYMIQLRNILDTFRCH